MIRNATMEDSEAILSLVNENAGKGLMLPKTPYSIYKNIQSFTVYESECKIVGCCRLGIAWNDLAEVASLAVADEYRKHGIGKNLVEDCVEKAKELKLKRLFALSYQAEFFKKCNFIEVPVSSLPYKVFGDCLNCPKVNCCDERAFILDI